jgi:hypothetical protein
MDKNKRQKQKQHCLPHFHFYISEKIIGDAFSYSENV